MKNVRLLNCLTDLLYFSKSEKNKTQKSTILKKKNLRNILIKFLKSEIATDDMENNAKFFCSLATSMIHA